ncbi:MAG: hypothetical protein J6S67_21235 [Methanobrevibacter sp.]|nr:hypothetical protein [Methanobrevibacter sp.]
MNKKILAIFSGIGAFFSAVFFVLFKQAKAERKALEKELEAESLRADSNEEVRKAESEIHKTLVEKEKENAELIEKAHSGNNLDNFNAGLELLRKQAESGQKRNSCNNKSGT